MSVAVPPSSSFSSFSRAGHCHPPFPSSGGSASSVTMMPRNTVGGGNVGGAAPAASAAASQQHLPAVASGFRRFVLEAEQELRIEAGTASASTESAAAASSSSTTTRPSGEGGGGEGASSSRSGRASDHGSRRGGGAAAAIVLRAGSGEVFGHELALHRPYHFGAKSGGLSFPVFTFHGCVVDVGPGGVGEGSGGEGGESGASESNDDNWWSSDGGGLHVYVATDRDDTVSCLACVNTHAQLEALRDEALASALASPTTTPANNSTKTAPAPLPLWGPRVLVLGGSGSGASSLVKTLVSYAVKLGRTPLWVDVDPGDNGVGLPGTLGVAVATRDSLTLSTILHGGGGMPIGSASPLALFHGSVVPQPDLFRAQVSGLGQKIYKRLSAVDNDWERSSGIVVNAPSWLALDENWEALVHAIRELKISVVLLTGHDKLYAKLMSLQQKSSTSSTSEESAEAPVGAGVDKNVVVVKLPRSGGVATRNPHQMRQLRSQSIRRYFYGDDLQESSGGGGGTAGSSATSAAGAAKGENPASAMGQPQPSLTPFLAQIKFDQVRLFRCTSMSLSSSLLPLGATQTTEKVQLQPVAINEHVTHHLLAVCHPHSVAQYDSSGSAQDLYGAGVAGFVVVERVLMETEMLHLLAPCAGALPSHTLLIGDITWLD